jgi:hypothetical protein
LRDEEGFVFKAIEFNSLEDGAKDAKVSPFLPKLSEDNFLDLDVDPAF